MSSSFAVDATFALQPDVESVRHRELHEDDDGTTDEQVFFETIPQRPAKDFDGGVAFGEHHDRLYTGRHKDTEERPRARVQKCCRSSSRGRGRCLP